MLLSRFFRRAQPCATDPALTSVKARLDSAENRLRLIEAELRVIKGDVTP